MPSEAATPANLGDLRVNINANGFDSFNNQQGAQ
jgi:hypothetical protein